MPDLKVLTDEDRRDAIKAVAEAVGWDAVNGLEGFFRVERPLTRTPDGEMDYEEFYIDEDPHDLPAAILALYDGVASKWGVVDCYLHSGSTGWCMSMGRGRTDYTPEKQEWWKAVRGFASELDARLALLAKIVAEVPKPEKEGGE